MAVMEQRFEPFEPQEQPDRRERRDRPPQTPEEMLDRMRGQLVFDSMGWVPKKWRPSLVEEFVHDLPESEKEQLAIEASWAESGIGTQLPTGEVASSLRDLSEGDLEKMVAGAIETVDFIPADKREAVSRQISERFRNTSEGRRELSEWLAEPMRELSVAAKKDTLDYMRLAVDTGAVEHLRSLIESYARKHRELFEDKRFRFQGEDGAEEHLMTESFGKLKTIEWLHDSFKDGQAKPDELSKIARFSFDANGLKAVNDLSGSHENGDEYLKRIAEVFRRNAKQSAARKKLEEMGVTENVIPLLGGGDEYSLLIKGERELDREDLDEVLQLYRSEIESIDTSDLVDFSDESVQLRYLGVPKSEFDAMTPESKAEVRRRMAAEMPPDFKMWASASGGVATLLEGLDCAINDSRETKRLTGNEPNARRMFEKTMGGLWDVSDGNAKTAKSEYKRQIETGNDYERFYAKVLKRTEEARQIKAQIDGLRSEAEMTDEVMARLEKMFEDETVDAESSDLFRHVVAEIESLSLNKQKGRDRWRGTAESSPTGDSSETGSPAEVGGEKTDISVRPDEARLVRLMAEKSAIAMPKASSEMDAELAEKLSHLPEARRAETMKALGQALKSVDERILSLQQEMDKVPVESGTQAARHSELQRQLTETLSARDEFINRELAMFDMAYADQRFEFTDQNGHTERMMKDSYGKDRMADWLSEMLKDREPQVEELNKIGRLFFDANGLKAVNDLSGSHAKGDEYLKRIAQVFRNEKSAAMGYLKTFGDDVEVIPLLGGGDEFALIVKSDRALEQVSLDRAVEMFLREIEALKVADLVDFNSFTVRSAFRDTPMPKGFKMRASASGGAATLGEGLRRAMDDRRPSKRLTGEEKSAREMYFKAMGGLWDQADGRADENKKEYKRRLASSEDEDNQFYSKVLKRTEEARQMEQEINELLSGLGRSELLTSRFLDLIGRGSGESEHEGAKTDMSVLGAETIRANARKMLADIREELKKTLGGDEA